MPKRVVERQLRLMRLGEIENACDEPVEGEFRYREDDPWVEVLDWAARIYVWENFPRLRQEGAADAELDLASLSG